ncbi:SERPINE1 mRNA-binding protein 1-like [Ochlerotatus camptorhynchus]|uniref:SERPINE1 mRNA-binding protein 1-like n=1 Tax=Ochlerotatus camptorhynchus TaxID=644619 RepID=UPI0031E07C00
MENTSYGINVANRYDLFSIDDEGDDPFETVTRKIQKNQKKNQTNPSTNADNAASKPITKKVKNAEKENKTTQNKVINNENRHPEKHDELKSSAAINNANLHNQRGEKHGIKETQKDNIRTTREDGNKNGYPGKNAERRQINKSNFSGTENREEKNNRKNREVSNDENGPRKSQPGNKRFDVRGKREFDRQSGSNKTGVKAVEKRDGTGSHNWGSAKLDAKEYNNFQEDYMPHDTEEEKAPASEQTKEEQTEQTEAKPVEEELKEMTLDEWKAQIAAARSKPQYNLRKAGEGENAAQWDKMIALDKKTTEVRAEEENEIQKTGKQKQVLEIEFHFNDGRRGGLMGRPRGRGGKGTPRNPGRREGEKKETNEIREIEPEKRDRRTRPPQPQADGNFKPKQSSRFNKSSAPKVDDEHDFPSLG